MRIKILHWVGTFGLLIPMETGVLWQHQTDGVSCNQIYIQGIYLELPEPFDWNDKTNRKIDYLELLTSANYDYDHKREKELWDKINDKLDFTYEEIEAPKGQPNNQEGIKWIKITKIKYPELEKKEKWSIISWKQDCKDLERKYKSLINKRIALIYPNCD